MWPHPFGSGDGRKTPRCCGHHRASMWPHPFGRGDREQFDVPDPEDGELQCGRTLSGAVMGQPELFNFQGPFRRVSSGVRLAAAGGRLAPPPHPFI